MENIPEIHCPLVTAIKLPEKDPRDLTPIIEYIQQGTIASDDITFPSGIIRVTPEAGQRLDLCKQSIGPNGARRVTAALSGHDGIQHILLGTGGIGDEGAQEVANLISVNDRIETVYLGCNLITQEGTKYLADALQGNQSVKALWLKRNPVGEEGAGHLSQMLKHNTVLRTLDLVNCAINEEALITLGKAIAEYNTALEALYLGGNGVSARSVSALCEMVNQSRLKALFLNVNHIGDEGIALFAKSLAPHAIASLGIGSNNISKDGFRRFFEKTMGRQNFQNVDFRYSPSTKVLGALGNRWCSSLNSLLVEWINNQERLESLALQGIGLVENDLTEIIPEIMGHPTLTNIGVGMNISDIELKNCLLSRFSAKRQNGELLGDYRDDAQFIRSVYR